MSPIEVLVVGQTPPPHHGQAIMIERLLAGRFDRVRLHHVRMAFSRTLGEVGRPSARKLGHLAGLIVAIARARARCGAEVLYYPPAGPDRLPLYRDIAILLAVRRLFRATVFHFHAGGLSQLVPRLSPVGRRLFRRAFDRPECAIRLSALNPPDGALIAARHDLVIPYGIEDVAPRYPPAPPTDAPLSILFVGALRAAKGVADLLAAAEHLRARGLRFRLRLMGAFHRPEFEAEVKAFLARSPIGPDVELLGELTGERKWRAFADASVFCFPTHYEAETFGVVLLEAMQFALPVVATRWRGIPSVVLDDTTGLLVPPRDPPALADALARLLGDADARRRLGAAGRERFLAEFSLERWYARMEAALVLAHGAGAAG